MFVDAYMSCNIQFNAGISIQHFLFTVSNKSNCAVVSGVKLPFHFEIVQLSPANLPQPVAWPSIHAPWYAYLAWTSFAHGDYKKLADTTFINAKLDKAQFCKANTKVCAVAAAAAAGR
jgi:hypothetical protein